MTPASTADVPDEVRNTVKIIRQDDAPWPKGIVAGYTTRWGGVSPAPLDNLTLSGHDEDVEIDRDVLKENWKRAVKALHPRLHPAGVVLINQSHGSQVLRAKKPSGPLGTIGIADGCVTTRPGLVLGVRASDCVPILMANRNAVGVAHAGWRGVEKQVVVRTVEAMLEITGGEPDEVVISLGPYISMKEYRIKKYAAARLVRRGKIPKELLRKAGDKFTTDLGHCLLYQLNKIGVTQVYTVAQCTSDINYFSWRRDGHNTGRHAGMISILPPERPKK